MKKNDEFELEITGMTAEGSGVGHVDGMAVFAANTAVGDKILAHAIKVKKNYAVAKAMQIITPSADRIEADCPVFNRCGGCVYRHISYEAELKIKWQRVDDVFRRIAGMPLNIQEIVGSEKTAFYRNKAQLPVGKDKDGNTKTGFYSSRTHNIIDCGCCMLQPEKFSGIANTVRSWIDENGISVYNEETHKGLVRHLYIRAAENCEEILVCIVINGNSLPHADSLKDKLCTLGVTGLCININKEKTNVVLGRETVNLWGKDRIEDVLCGIKFEISPHSFYQVNRAQAERLYSIAAEYAKLDKNTTLLDMYCGVGTIGLSMAKNVRQLIGVEIVPDAVENAKKNAEKNGIENTRFICGDAAVAAAQLEKEGVKPDVIILDPPRKGCDEALIKTVAKMNPERIVYISCDPATLARDCAVFATLGYTVPEENGRHLVTPVDMFPRTAHCEVVVQLSQRKPDAHIDIDLDLDEFDVTAAEAKATYGEIKDYVFKKFGLKVSSLNIAQTKTKYGIIERENYNKGKEGHRVPNCPKEKEDAIVDALKYFKMI